MYKYETHFHTAEVSGCGKVGAEEGVRLYAEHGYHGIMITDHFYAWNKKLYPMWKDYIEFFLTGYRLAKKAGEKYGIDVLLGAEIRFDDHPNDYLSFGFDENYLYNTENLMGMTLKQYKESIKDSDTVIFQAHPFRVNCEIMPAEYLDGLETFNGNPRHNSYNNAAEVYAKENNLPGLSGSDFHQVMDLARGGVLTEKKCVNGKELAFVIKNRKYKLITY